ncbi:MAG: V-type ATP synthase subunit E family protein [Planctomycetota bacterium]
MSQDNLLTHMENEAERELHAIRSSADDEADKIRLEAEKRSASIRDEMRRDAAAEITKQRALLMHKVRLEAAKKAGLAKAALVAGAVEAVAARLMALRIENRYSDIFSRLADEALREMRDPARVIVSPEDEERCRVILQQRGCPAEIELSPGIWGGIILTTKDGKERIVNTLNSRFERSRPILLRVLAEELFGAKDGHDNADE